MKEVRVSVLDPAPWQDRVLSGSRTAGAGARADLEAVTDTRWVTVRAESARYPFRGGPP